jgi:LEA14-like dessication related protein
MDRFLNIGIINYRNKGMEMKVKLMLAILTVALIGCAQVPVGKPEIRGISHEWGEITHSTTEILTNVRVYNPNPVSLPLKDVLTEVYMDGIRTGEGSALKAEIKANAESTVMISTKLENEIIPEWWVEHIRKDEKSKMNVKGFLVFDLKFTEFRWPFEISNPIETDILAGLSSEKPQEVGVGVKFTIKSTKSYWGKVSEADTEIVTLATIYNDNPMSISVTRLDYLVDMNGIKLAEGSSDVATVIQPRSEVTLTLITKLDNKMLDEWWVTHIKNWERTKVKILLQPVVEVEGKKFKFTLAEKEDGLTTNLLG